MLRLGSIRRLATRTHRDERGMTLVELLVGITGALIVLTAGFTALTIADRIQVRTADRIDATQRGRLGMERITRGIRSQQCLTSDTAAMQWASDRGLQFYSSVTEARTGAQQVQRRRFEWVPVSSTSRGFAAGTDVGDVVETVWTASNDTPPYTFPTSPTTRTIVATDVQQDGSTPMFRYFGYESGAVGRPSVNPYPLVTFSSATLNPNNRPSVAEANLPRVVLVEIRFLARPRRGETVRSLTVPFYNRVSVRTADPTDPMRSPLCL